MQTTVRTKPTKYRELDADACIRKYRRETWATAGIAMVLVLLNAGTFLTYTEELSFWLYLFLMILILLVYCGTIVVRTLGLYEILYTDCDPVKFFEILRGLQKKSKRFKTRNTLYLQCAMTRSYMGDWDGVYSELAQFQPSRSKNRNFKYIHLNLLGDYCLVKDQREDFEACRAQLLSEAEKRGSRDRKLVDEILLTWDRRIACLMQDKEKERELLNRLLLQKKKLIQEVTWTFRLAQLDLLENKITDAKERLQFVIEYGNTLPVRKWAQELWKEQE